MKHKCNKKEKPFLFLPTRTYNLIPLVNVIGTGEEDVAADHFAHDAADRPKVHILFVAHAKDNLELHQVLAL